jgi:hypothetical protein
MWTTFPGLFGFIVTPIGGQYLSNVRGYDPPPVFELLKEILPVWSLKGKMSAAAARLVW